MSLFLFFVMIYITSASAMLGYFFGQCISVGFTGAIQRHAGNMTWGLPEYEEHGFFVKHIEFFALVSWCCQIFLPFVNTRRALSI